MSLVYRTMIINIIVCMLAAPVAAVLRLRTGWPFEQALGFVLFLFPSVLVVVVDVNNQRGHRLRTGTVCLAGAVVLLLVALGYDALMRSAYPPFLTIGASVVLGAGWLFWARDLSRRSRVRRA